MFSEPHSGKFPMNAVSSARQIFPKQFASSSNVHNKHLVKIIMTGTPQHIFKSGEMGHFHEKCDLFHMR